MVVFISPSRSQPCPLWGLIVLGVKTPKNADHTLTMVVCSTYHINEIKWCKKFGNVLVIMNMPLDCSIDARIIQIETKNRGDYRATYSVLGSLKMLGFGWDSLCECLGSDWNKSRSLKTPLTWILISHFFVIFSLFVLPLPTISNPYFMCFCFLMYHSVH